MCMAVQGSGEDKEDENWDFLDDETGNVDDDKGQENIKKDDDDLFAKPAEAHDARVRPSPCLPSRAEVEKHECTHYPYRSWCKVCVAAKARELPHARRGLNGKDEETGLPTIAMDYEHIEDKITMLVAKDELSGAVLAYDCECKGPKDAWVVRQLARDLADWGRADICLKSDGEAAMLAMQTALASTRTARTILRNPPAYNPQTNGAAEKAVQDVTAHVRVLLLALEDRLKVKIDVKLPVVKWMIRHAAFLHTRYSVGHDGLTPWRRLTGKNWTGAVVEFGECVLGKLALKKPNLDKKAKKTKKKLVARSVEGIYVGLYPRTGEHLISRLDGEVIRVRTVTRMVVQDRWNPDKVLGIRAMPRMPNPNIAKDADIEGKLNTENADDALGHKAGDAVPQETPELAPDHTGPRELRITDRILEKYGYTEGCQGCAHKQLGLEHRGHSRACRNRIYAAMKDDEDELDRLIKNQERLGKIPPKDERIRRETPDTVLPPHADGPERPEQDPVGVDMGTLKGGIDGTGRTDGAAEINPGTRKGEDPGNRGGDMGPNGREGHGEDDDEPMNPADDVLNAENAAATDHHDANDSDADEDIQRGLFAPDSDDNESEAEDPDPKIAAAEDPTHAVERPEKRMRLSMLSTLNAVMNKPDVKKIIRELEELPELKLPNHRQRRTLKQNGYGSDVAELYSPPRVTKIASDMRLDPAFALDLTTIDPDDGMPWDFTVKAKRDKAKKKVEEEKPLMTIVCPMCGPFSALMNWNYAKKSEDETKAILKAAMEHLKFAMEICLIQYAAGRMFLFEHPVGATSWGTNMVQKVMNLEGIYLAKFDFCQLGMTTTGDDGEVAAAKKRTGVLTNSKNIAEALRQAQCNGAHRHVHLTNGKAGPCQVYPDKFVKLVCAGIQKEADDLKWRDKLMKELDVTDTINALIETTEAMENETGEHVTEAPSLNVLYRANDKLPVPPHEEDKQHAGYDDLYRDREFYDDASGAPLNKELAT